MISGERIVEWLFIPRETCVSSRSFDTAGTQQRKNHFSILQQERRQGESRQYANKKTVTNCSESCKRVAQRSIQVDDGAGPPLSRESGKDFPEEAAE